MKFYILSKMYLHDKCNFRNTSINLTSLEITNFETSKVRDMQYMFNGCNNSYK